MNETDSARLCDALSARLDRLESAFAACGDTQEVRDGLQQLEQDSQAHAPEWSSALDWRLSALWMDVGDREAGRASMERYLRRPEGFYDDLCFRARLAAFLGDEARCTDYLRRAEEMMYSSFTWSTLAAVWHVLGNHEDAARCVRMGEAVADADIPSWCTLADTWSTLGQPADARRCVDRAAGLGPDADGWVRLARLWRGLGDDAQMQRAMQEAATMALSPRHWLDCAVFWAEVPEPEKVREAMRAAEALARRRNHWRDCAATWRELSEPTESERCEALAESI